MSQTQGNPVLDVRCIRCVPSNEIALIKRTAVSVKGAHVGLWTRLWRVAENVLQREVNLCASRSPASPKGAEKIAACWADARKVPQVAFRLDFKRHKNAAPFKRNDQLLDVLPIGVLVFPGFGISDNLADKQRSSASRCLTSAKEAAHRRRSRCPAQQCMN